MFNKIAVIGDVPSMILMIAIVAFMIVASFFLIKWIIKDYKINKEEKSFLIDGVMSKSEINSYVSTYITKTGADTSFTLLSIDLDNFGNINDAFGQKETKRVYETIAKRIISKLPRKAKIGAYSSDRFLVFLSNEFEKKRVAEITAEIQEEINEPISLFMDTTVSTTASIGVAFFPIHGDNLKEITKSLELVVYLIKKNGGNEVRAYSNDISQKETENMEYYYQIRDAMAKKEFQLFYQPIIDIKNNKVYGVESLLRWNHPEHGILSPYSFMNIMEQTGDITWVGLWGLEGIIQSYYDFIEATGNPDFKISINLSPKQLLNKNLTNDFQKVLKKYKMNPQNIILEIAEFALFEKQSQIYTSLTQLKKIGFMIAIDGFSIDNATVSQLEHTATDVIKLEREFATEEMTFLTEKIMNVIVEMAEKRKIDIISLGTEAKENLSKLDKFNIHLAQGYYFATPMSKDDFKKYLQSGDLISNKNNANAMNSEEDSDIIETAPLVHEDETVVNTIVEENKTETSEIDEVVSNDEELKVKETAPKKKVTNPKSNLESKTKKTATKKDTK